MGANTKIQWTDYTFNPWWGCTRVSPGCEHCYAEAFAKRCGVQWGVKAERRFFGDKHWAEPLKWNAAAAKLGERRRVFCASMADVFEDRDDLRAERAKLFSLIHTTPHLDWLLLSKRPENMERLADARWIHGWPSNVWAGCTVEDQRRADERIPHLLRVPAAVRFLSCEPLLERVDLTGVLEVKNGSEAARERNLSASGVGDASNRQERRDMERFSTSRETNDDGLLDGARDGRRDEGARPGSSTGMEAPARRDPKRDDGESHRRESLEQRAVESRTRDVLGADGSFSPGAEARDTDRRAQSERQADERCGGGDSDSSVAWRAAQIDREGLRSERSNNQQDRPRPALDWIIIGGESGPGARPFDLAWARSIVEQCKAAGVACFVKQLGARPREYVPPPGAPDDGGDLITLRLRDRKGGDISEFPPELRVREWPEARR